MINKKIDYDFIEFLALAPYRLLGEKTKKFSAIFIGLQSQLMRADIKVAHEAYVAMIILFTSLGGVSIFAATILVSLISGATFIAAILVAFIMGSIGTSIIFITLFFYPSMQVGNRKRILEEELPYVASHMAVLSKANMPPERIFRSITQVEDLGMKSIAAEESRNIIRDVNFLGFDIISAMERRIRYAPSPKFVDFLDGFISVSRSGGSLTSFFMATAKALMDSARIAARQLLETLGGIAEAYISMMVVFPLLVIVMLSIMGMIGGNLGGFGVLFIMQLVTYLAIPAFALILLLLLDSIIPPR
ncbi:MAG: type II secretion system F family protein [Candidatus Bathyarchaeia archaeon]